MDRVSDESILYSIEYYSVGEGSDDEVVKALTELRERRAAEKSDPYAAEWTNLQCPKCKHYSVCVDKIGYRCVIDGCDWQRDLGNKAYVPHPNCPCVEK
jgi:hypothetical protein